MVIAIDGRIQSLWPARLTMTGRANDATSSMTVAPLTERSMRLASGLVGLWPVPEVTRMAYTKTTTTMTTNPPMSAGTAPRPMMRQPRTSQKVAKASWMKPPTRRTRSDHAAAAVSSPPVGVSGTVMLCSLASGTRSWCP